MKSGSYGAEFVSGTGNCDPASIYLETCDIHPAFIHEVCLQSTIGNDTLTCPAMIAESLTQRLTLWHILCSQEFCKNTNQNQ
jgi:hypothetical protein